MKPNERFLRAIRRQSVDRIPKHAFWTAEVIKKFEEKTGCKDPDEYFGLEQRIVEYSPNTFNPKIEEYFKNLNSTGRVKKRNWDDWDVKKHGYKTIDEWGVYRDYGNFYHFHKMTPTMTDLETVSDLKNWPWPVICDEQYFKNLKTTIDEFKEKNIATIGYYGCIFEQAWYLRGMDKLMMDFYYNKQFADYLLNKIAEIDKIAALKINSLGIDLLYTGDDVATQIDLMMSLEMWRKWIKPPTKRIIDEIKKINPEALIWYHSDGNNYKILADLVEIGCDVLHPLQPECMDPVKIHKELGNCVAFWGTIGTQSLMPFGTPEKINKEVKRIINEFDAFKGGLIIAPTHFLEPDVPWENIVAFFNAVEEI